jgi:hypothetical protein
MPHAAAVARSSSSSDQASEQLVGDGAVERGNEHSERLVERLGRIVAGLVELE